MSGRGRGGEGNSDERVGEGREWETGREGRRERREREGRREEEGKAVEVKGRNGRGLGLAVE